MIKVESATELSEIEKVQNPAFCCVLLWTFGRAYQDSVSQKSANLLLYFLILPLCLHRPTMEKISSTQKRMGLGKFCEKMNAEREELFALHDRCLVLRKLTLNAIAFGIRAGLLSINYEKGELRALDAQLPSTPERIKAHIKSSEKVGPWFAALETNQIFSALKVEA